MNDSYNVQVLERTVKVLEVMAKYPYGMALTDISRDVNLNKSTVFRILATLQYYGYIMQDNDGKYKLGYKFLELSSAVMERLDIRKIAHPYLDELSRITGEVVHLVILDGYEGVYIDKVDNSSGTIRMYSQVGKHIPLHCTGVGKVLLAAMSVEEVEKVIGLKGLPKRTENTITDAGKLFEELQKIKEQGYAIDDIENEEGIRCVAAPILNYHGETIAAVSISGPTLRVTRERVPELVHLLKDYTLDISRELGYKANDENII
ncbi:MAG: IclR family transcriptional regulator [Thermoanaerobacteraceae bacterium]|nr:IclR family transcriptional regulator [Thermoanaerobacteraceae bacterium]